jgi:hypothetical protein
MSVTLCSTFLIQRMVNSIVLNNVVICLRIELQRLRKYEQVKLMS